jgi:uncharacterized protein
MKTFVLGGILAMALASNATSEAAGTVFLDLVPGAAFRPGGETGRRLDANLQNWTLRAPDANPAMLGMFRLRDREWPYPDLMPWAGEFAGKYLIGAVQALSYTDDPALGAYLKEFVATLCSLQAEDGYLGPFRKEERLMGRWDLWGHYHVMQGLLLWHDATGDPEALATVRRMGDAVCAAYPEGGRRPLEAGDSHTNFSVIHAMADLYRRTGEERYMAFIRRVLADMNDVGDWLRKGAAGVPFSELDRGGPQNYGMANRWEALHILQGFVTLHEITGEPDFRAAALNFWEGMRDHDRHPSGAFSTHEQAMGTVYIDGAIETCCTVAWEALTIDVLRLTGDAKVADELEMTLWNAVFGSLHPSGSWCTYDNPINGTRYPSWHQINFQARVGAPELNCCSVNASRGLTMLRDWAVMSAPGALAINYYGPGSFTGTLDGTEVTIDQETDYPVSGEVRLAVSPSKPKEFALRLRVPAWSREARVTVNGQQTESSPEPGTYFEINRKWKKGDRVTLELEMTQREWKGEDGRAGRSALYWGPLLLAFDTHFNETELSALGSVKAETVELLEKPVSGGAARFAPIGLWHAQTEAGPVTLCDFGSAGAHGTAFAAWLPTNVVVAVSPEEGATAGPGLVLFRWNMPGAATEVDVVIAEDPGMTREMTRLAGTPDGYVTWESTPGTYYWTVVSKGRKVTQPEDARKLTITESGPAHFAGFGEGLTLFDDTLPGAPKPSFGALEKANALTPAGGPSGKAATAVQMDGVESLLVYKIPFIPSGAYSVQGWVCVGSYPENGIAQVFSAWHAPMDDPLRVPLANGMVFAQIEHQGMHGTPGVPLEPGAWHHLAAVKNGGKLMLYIDGTLRAEAPVPARVHSMAQQIGLGCNPLYPPGERMDGQLAKFSFHARALDAAEVAALAQEK